jgi:outer membrane protein OmpU
MNILKKVSLTALGTSLIATSAFAASLDVTGGASLTFAGQDNNTKGNGWTMNDEVTFSGSGEMDNGWNVSVSMQLDNNAQDTAGNNMDNRSLKIDMSDMGTLTFYGHGADTAMSMMDDKMPHADGNEAWDIVGAGARGGSGTVTTKFGSIAGNGNVGNNMFHYSNSSLMDGLQVNVSVSPSDSSNVEATTSYSLTYTGVEGLTVGAGWDENSEAGDLQTDFETIYATYAYGPITVGYQTSESDSATAADVDEFTAYGVSYAVSDDLTVSYNESSYDDGGTTSDEESAAFGVSYTMGSMSVTGVMTSMDNIGGSTTDIDDVEGYEVGVSFAF